MIDITKGICDICIEEKDNINWNTSEYSININGKHLRFCKDCLLDFYDSLSKEIEKIKEGDNNV